MPQHRLQLNRDVARAGTGVVCVLTFQAKAPGQSGLSIMRFSLNGAEQKVPAQAGQATIVVK